MRLCGCMTASTPTSVRRAGLCMWGGMLRAMRRSYRSERYLGIIERVRAAERELIESPDVEFRFHSGVPV